jgi:hypothetical protein
MGMEEEQRDLFQCKSLSVSPSKAMRPRSCSVLAARVTSAVSNSSCLSGGSAAFMYATSAAIVSASVGVYVVRKR